MKNFKRQKGVAVIIVALSMVAIGGMAQLTIEGGRMIQERDRLADATEAATLAVAIANRTGPHVSDELARSYLETYLPNIKIDDVTVTRTEGEEKVDGDQLYYVQYEVGADVGLERQMGFIDSSSDTSSYQVGNDAMARTYMLPSDLDLVFVADFSASMKEPWGDDGKTQLQHLKEQVDIISEDLLFSSATNAGYAHRIGFVPFNMRTIEDLNGTHRCVTELEYKSIDGVVYNKINWELWGKEDSSIVSQCARNNNNNNNNNNNTSNCPSDLPQAHAKAIQSIFSKSSSETKYNSVRWPDPLGYVDIEKTVANWNKTKTTLLSLHPVASSSGLKLFSGSMCGSKEDFYTIPLSLQKPDIEDMKAGGGTAVYQGLIRAAQILADGRSNLDPDKLEKYHERAQMLLILSDGGEDPFEETFTSLVNEGLCVNIRKHFNDHDSPLYIGVIGINFDASKQPGFQKCAGGEENIIDVSKSDELLEKIKELIQKGAATNGVSRLYDKNL
ncbi:TadE/TadG family type IV pilus assembly protein [Vibrio ezurae]|uniref:VWFA domain-containing protein n=1 Tax=Vibrio ezurae NBRC 102218 TaxID=1219080 RepID=U3CC60_9VIBR|nr:hypothetical protein [Vibrio ezurae]GAD78894.1 hypothetical protein VEZ01S_07_00710 [Vibrio ezurae NBRC 102218]